MFHLRFYHSKVFFTACCLTFKKLLLSTVFESVACLAHFEIITPSEVVIVYIFIHFNVDTELLKFSRLLS